MGRCLPICADLSSLRKVILRALTGKQILILKEIEQNTGFTQSSVIKEISRKRKIPPSTLKLNIKILKEVGLLFASQNKPIRLTGTGKRLLSLLDSPHSSTGRASGCRPEDAGSKHPACQRQAPCDSPAGETG